jgi:hypothetical protein
LLQQRIPLDPTIHENFSSSRYPNSLCPLSDERERLTARKNIALVSGGKKEAEATLNASAQARPSQCGYIRRFRECVNSSLGRLGYQRMAVLRYGFFIEFLSPRATTDLKRAGRCSRRNDDATLSLVCLPNDYRSIGCGSCISLCGTTGAICNATPSISDTAGAVRADHGRLSTGGICARRRKDRRWAGGRLRPSHVQGTAQRPKASKALPQVDPQIVAACKASNPSFRKGNLQRVEKNQQKAPQ